MVKRIAVVDDHPLVRDGVIHAIRNEDDFEVVALGETAKDAIDAVIATQPDILVLDLSIPGGGSEALIEIKKNTTETKVLILTVSDDEDDVFRLLALGASGYVLKGTTADELILALRKVALGEQYVTPSLAIRMLSDIASQKQPAQAVSLLDLTIRERQIAIMVGQGDSNKMIARSLMLSDKTIKHYLTIIFRKVQVTNRVELAEWLKHQITLDETT